MNILTSKIFAYDARYKIRISYIYVYIIILCWKALVLVRQSKLDIVCACIAVMYTKSFDYFKNKLEYWLIFFLSNFLMKNIISYTCAGGYRRDEKCGAYHVIANVYIRLFTLSALYREIWNIKSKNRISMKHQESYNIDRSVKKNVCITVAAFEKII